ncbi:TPA: hypothetical protein ACKLO9_001530 [Neisseria gonorrhoeae]
MTTVYVDLVNLDGSRPEGALRFSLDRLALGDPDVVPSSVGAKIRDGKARVDDLLPGAMRVRVSTGGWSKSWRVTIPESGDHDLFDLLGLQTKEFQETAWAALAGRVEKLEQAPAVDLAPLEKRITALENTPNPDLTKYVPRSEYDALIQRVVALENATPTDFGENHITPQVSMSFDMRPYMAVKEWAALYAISQAAPPEVDKLAFINKALSTSLGEVTGVTSIDSLMVVDPSGTKLAEVYAAYVKEKSSDFVEFEKLLDRFARAVSDGEVVL